MNHLNIFGLWRDHGVFQRDRPVPVLGAALPGSSISVAMGNQTAHAVASEKGEWSVDLPEFAAGGPFKLRIKTSTSEEIAVEDLWAGDVWICSGQSNMEWSLAQLPMDADTQRDHPHIRFFRLDTRWAVKPTDEVQGKWRISSAATSGLCSGVAWYFARRLQSKTHVPIGLVVTAWGGTEIAAWMPRSSLEALPEGSAFLDRIAHEGVSPIPGPHEDFGIASHAEGWATDTTEEGWEHYGPPRHWQQVGLEFNGAVWFRRAIALPTHWASRRLVLSLGIVDDFEQTWVNGRIVGKTCAETAGAYLLPRLYTVPAMNVVEGKLIITVRIFDQMGTGGFTGPASTMWIAPYDAPQEAIFLGNEWRYRVESRLPLRGSGNGVTPTTLYNARVWPLRNTPARGILWYQGETDNLRADLYRRMLPELIRTWRATWGDGQLPFYIVQLAAYQQPQTEPSEDPWAELRDAQLNTAQTVPNTGMAVAIDIGAADDIHPTDKKTVGERLARWAMHQVYGDTELVPSGPLYRGYQHHGPGIAVQFRYAEGLTTSNGLAPAGFTVAGLDRKFHFAEAYIEGKSVHVSSTEVRVPIAVRYAWHTNPVNANLCNRAGLPASPFRTDDWPLSTAGNV